MHDRIASTVLFVCLLSFVALPMVAAGQDDMATDNKGDVSNKSASDLRRDVYQAEEDFYAVFNKLNDEKDYEVRCFYEKATGTNIKNHVCRARFVTKAFERHARRNRNDLSRVANQTSDPVLAEKTAKYEAKIEALLVSSPELQAAFDRYNAARVEFMATQ